MVRNSIPGCTNKKHSGNTLCICNDTREKRALGAKRLYCILFHNEDTEAVLKKARNSVNGKDIRIQGGANIIQQFLNTGLIDDFTIHITPVILGSGIRLFENINRDLYDIKIVDVKPSELTTHLKYKLMRN